MKNMTIAALSYAADGRYCRVGLSQYMTADITAGYPNTPELPRSRIIVTETPKA